MMCRKHKIPLPCFYDTGLEEEWVAGGKESERKEVPGGMVSDTGSSGKYELRKVFEARLI